MELFTLSATELSRGFALVTPILMLAAVFYGRPISKLEKDGLLPQAGDNIAAINLAVTTAKRRYVSRWEFKLIQDRVEKLCLKMPLRQGGV